MLNTYKNLDKKVQESSLEIKGINQNLSQLIKSNRKNLEIFITYSKHFYTKQNQEIANLNFITQGVKSEKETAQNLQFNELNNEVLKTLRSRLNKIENITNDYIQAFVIPLANEKIGKLQKTYILLEEKFECLMFLVQNFNLLDLKII